MNQVTLCENVFHPSSWETHNVNGDIREFLVNRFGVWPETARIYHKEVTLASDVTPSDEASIERLAKLEGPFFVVVYPGDPITIFIIVAVAVLAVAVAVSFLLRPSSPNVKNQHQESANNSLGSRQNVERPMQRIPDIFGQIWDTPDLIQLPYRVFKNNAEVEYMYCCIGRGKYDIGPIRDDLTPIDEIDGASVEVYAPNTSPNSGDAPQVRIGLPIKEKIKTVKRSNAVDGQILLPPNKDSFKSNNNIAFQPDTIITNSSNIDFTNFFSVGTVADPTFLTIAGSNAKNPATGASLNLDGTYQIVGVSPNAIVLSNPAAVNGNWTTLASYAGTTSAFGNATIVQIDSGWVGPFIVNEPIVNEIWCNFVCQQGLYEMDSKGNQIALQVTVEVGIQAINAALAPIGTEVFFLGTILGSSDSKAMRGTTVKCVLPLAGPCQVRARRRSNTDLRDNYQVVDQTQWRDMSSVAPLPVGMLHFGNVTTIQAVTYPTPDALAIKERKLNLLIARMIPGATLAIKPSPTGVTVHVVTSHLNAGIFDLNWSDSGHSVSHALFIAGFYEKVEQTLVLPLDVDFATLEISFDPYGTIGGDVTPPGIVRMYDIWIAVEWADGSTAKVRPSNFTVVPSGTSTTANPTFGYDSDPDSYAEIDRFHFSGLSDPAYIGYGPFDAVESFTGDAVIVSYGSPEAASTCAADIIMAMALDPFIGGRLRAEMDVVGIYDVLGNGGQVQGYFGTHRCIEFCYAFDDSKVSFEEMLADVATDVFCTAFRRGSVISVFFEKQTSNSIMLFNHRNKIPDSESRTVSFGLLTGYDGIQLDYIDPHAPNTPDNDVVVSLYYPPDRSAKFPKQITCVGIRNNVQAYMLGWRMYQKLLFQNTAVQFRSTQEATPRILMERILVADNTRPETQDGEVLEQVVLELTLSQDVVFVGGRTYTIFLQHYDDTVESIGITAGSADNKVVLASPPSIPLVLDQTKFARTTYVIVDDSPVRKEAFLLSEKTPQDGMLFDIKAFNYDDRYYAHDGDFIAHIVSENTHTAGGDGGFNAGYGAGSNNQQNVFVGGNCMPWLRAPNPAYVYGNNDGTPPVVVPLSGVAGTDISVEYVSGTVQFSDSHPYVDALGFLGSGPTDSTAGPYGLYYPTKYSNESVTGRGGLIGCFTDAGGHFIQAFEVGLGRTIAIPVGATQLQLGIDDDKYYDNRGGFNVQIIQEGTGTSTDPVPDPTIVDPGATIYEITANGV